MLATTVAKKKQTVYVETSVVSYLTARLSSDLIMAAHQKITIDWWENRRYHFDLYTSLLVIQEAGRGDSQAAKKRLNALQDMPLLDINEEVQKLAETFLYRQVIPEKAREDAIHISMAITYGIDYLLTWNCKHIANAEIQKIITEISTQEGYEMPIFCTPEVLMGE